MQLTSLLSSSVLLAASAFAQAPAPAITQSVAGAAAVAPQPIAATAPVAQPATAGAGGGLVAAGAAPPPAGTISEAVAGQPAAGATPVAGASAAPNAGGALVASGAAPAQQASTISEAVQGQGAVGAATSSTLQGLGGSLTSSTFGSTSTATTGTTTGGVTVWVVNVGSTNNTEVFSPDTVIAKPGDMVQFQFYANNHSVASASFSQPCIPQAQSSPSTAATAFWSGFMPTTAMGQLTYTIPVRDTNPVWFYCSQARHCQSGMVGAINPPTTGQTLDMFRAAAAQAPENVTPSSPAGTTSGGGQIGGTTSGSAAAASATKSAATGTRRSGLGFVVVALAAWVVL